MGISFNGDSKIPWDRPEGCPAGFEPVEIVVGFSNFGGMALEIAITRWTKKEPPSAKELNRLHTIRTNKRATPVVLVVELDSGGTLLFGPKASAAAVGPLPTEQSQRIVQSALDESSVFEARKRLAALVLSIDSTSMPGVSNSGLFANHELKVGVPKRADWDEACKASNPLLKLKGKELIEKLGYQTGQFGAHALLLTGSGPKAEALAVLLNDQEAFDADSPRFTVSPVAYGLNMADKQGVPWLILVRGNQIRLYSSRKDFGVGRKGLAETFFEVDLPQLTTANSGYLQLIFSAKALAEGGTTYEILKSSTQYAVALGERLRDKVYEDIIPELSVAVADALMGKGYDMDPAGCDLAYQLTLRVFFRMLFQVYAEDRKLLPYGENENYDHNAIKTRAKNLAKNPDQIFDENSSAFWDDLMQVWRVIDSGDKAWGVPAYNGGLFSSDSELSEHGSILSEIRIMNDVMGPVLKALLLDEAEDGSIGPVDFRSLSVREFGTIYEGLLESSLGLAEVDLTLDEDGTWIPAKKKDEIYAYAGQVYFHNTSGQRKGTGSYFTPSFVVEHLLERSLDPALDSHLAQVAALMKKGDHAGAAEKFFDFRVADLAMGSGHFLTSAIDHIEQKMAAFLAEDGQSIPGVAAELLKLEKAAKEALGDDSVELERSSLLRRQIARRCIYGLDINPIAVELARVSIWIHTFVRGLPMSSLDHNLVCGNSLTGIGSVDEALDVLAPGRKGKMTLFDEPIVNALESARTVLVDAALLAEATKDESRAASKAAKKAYKDAEKARLLFDAAVLSRIGRGDLVDAVDPDAISKLASRPVAQEVVESLMPAHMPVLFPEVFLRETKGFDVLIGNPPWDELHVNADKFWVRYFPGHMNYSDAEKEKQRKKYAKLRPDLVKTLEAEQASTDSARIAIKAVHKASDLYQAFMWRYLVLLSSAGRLGVVLPRGATVGASLDVWRKEALALGSFAEVMHCVNKGGWMFESVHPQTQIILLSYARNGNNNKQSEVCTQGIARSYSEFKDLSFAKLQALSMTELESISANFMVPAIPRPDLVTAFMKMRLSPSIGRAERSDALDIGFDGIARVAREAESAKAGSKTGLCIVQGKHIRHWQVACGDEWIEFAGDARLRNRPGIGFRKLARSDDSRTFICAPIPAATFVKETGFWIKSQKDDFNHEVYLLGVLSSRIFDWYTRCLVDRHILPSLAKSFPVPEFDGSNVLHQEIINLVRTLFPADGMKQYSFDGTKVGDSATTHALEGLVAVVYGLSESELIGMLQTFHPTFDSTTCIPNAIKSYRRFSK